MTFWFSLGPYLFIFIFCWWYWGLNLWPLPTRHMLYRAPIRTRSSNRSTRDFTELTEQTQGCSRMWEQRHRTVRAQDGATKYQRLQWASSQALLGKAAHLLQPCWNVHLLADCSFPRSASLNLSWGSSHGESRRDLTSVWQNMSVSIFSCLCLSFKQIFRALELNFSEISVGCWNLKKKQKTKELPKHGGSTSAPAPVTLE